MVDINMEIIMVHAQDHLMTSTTCEKCSWNVGDYKAMVKVRLTREKDAVDMKRSKEIKKHERIALWILGLIALLFVMP